MADVGLACCVNCEFSKGPVFYDRCWFLLKIVKCPEVACALRGPHRHFVNIVLKISSQLYNLFPSIKTLRGPHIETHVYYEACIKELLTCRGPFWGLNRNANINGPAQSECVSHLTCKIP